MRGFFHRAAVTCAGLALAASVTTAPVAQAGDLPARATYFMNLSYDDFARAPREEPFEWSTDGCSHPLADPDMRPACVQHDFGYRNFGNHYALKLEPTRRRKDWIDSRFHIEMVRICDDKYKPELPEAWATCNDHASVMFTAVSLFGDSSFF